MRTAGYSALLAISLSFRHNDHTERSLAAPAFSFHEKPVSPFLELGAYEALWDEEGTTFKSLADRFAAFPGSLPTDFVRAEVGESFAGMAVSILRQSGVGRFGVRVNGAGDYPPRLRDADHPIELLYYQGIWDLVETKCVAVVGARKPSPEGLSMASEIATRLAIDGFTVTSGLAEGIDTAAHGAAVRLGLPTVAVIGTPLSVCYPSQNRTLQRFIAKENLLISQVPVCCYERLSYKVKPTFFPARNITMSALTCATIIVEAGNSSGTLIQARAALKQKRKLFILDACFRNKSLVWPRYYEGRGALRVSTYGDIARQLG